MTFNPILLFDVASPAEMLAPILIVLVVFFVLMFSAIGLTAFFLVRWLQNRRIK